MRLLVVGINFHPELTGIGKYTGEMAKYLSGRGHEVHMVTAPPYYPYWQVQSGYKAWGYKQDEWHAIKIYRCPLWVPRSPSGLKRLIHLFSFALSSFPVLLGQISWKPDVVMCIAPAFFCAPFAWITARVSGAKAWLHIQDFELDAATSLGMLRPDHFLTRWAARLEKWLLSRFDRVSTISERMRSRLTEKGVAPQRAVLFPNWVDVKEIFPLECSQRSVREAFKIPEDQTVILYSGNMGRKHGLESVVAAARELQAHQRLQFILCGEGAARTDLEMAGRDLPNIQFLPLQPPEKLNQLLNSADFHILPQMADAADLVMPSKLLGMLASGRPVIATANAGTEIGNVVCQMGVLVPPGDTQALCAGILELAESPDMRARLGEKGRAFVCETWGMETILDGFELRLQELIEV